MLKSYIKSISVATDYAAYSSYGSLCPVAEISVIRKNCILTNLWKVQKSILESIIHKHKKNI